MKRFEKNLRGLISRSAASDVVETVPNEHLSKADARELKALGLVSIAPAGDNLLRVQLTDEGRVYFFRKAESMKSVWRDRLISYVLGVLTPLTVWAIQLWLAG